MALNLEAIGKPIGPLIREYSWKDTVLYGLAVGAGFSELEFCYESYLKVLPTFSMAATFDFFWRIGTESGADPKGVLHGEQDLVFHRPIPPEGVLTTNGAITGIFDKGKKKGAIIIAESETRHSNGETLFTGEFTIFARRDGGFGGANHSAPTFVFPNNDPDQVVDDRPGENQPLLYRLTGDLFPLHADPEFARAAGFDRPIMHGMGTLGFACRALIRILTPGAPERVRRLSCRFSRPLYPGVPIATQIWKTGDGHAVWKTINMETGETVLDNGRFEFEGQKSSLTHKEAEADADSLLKQVHATLYELEQRVDLEEFGGKELLFQFHLEGVSQPDWQLVIAKDRCRVLKGKADTPDCTLSLTGDDVILLFRGKLEPVTAYTEGRLRVDGDLSHALLLMQSLALG